MHSSALDSRFPVALWQGPQQSHGNAELLGSCSSSSEVSLLGLTKALDVLLTLHGVSAKVHMENATAIYKEPFMKSRCVSIFKKRKTA